MPTTCRNGIPLWLLSGILAMLFGSNTTTSVAAEEQLTVVGSSTVESATASDSRESPRLSRLQVLVMSFTVFTLAVLVGFEIIAKVPPTLHTPLMSGSNAISGITVVGALLAAGNAQGGFACFLGMLALILANINVVGGFLVTHRMLMMFKKK